LGVYDDGSERGLNLVACSARSGGCVASRGGKLTDWVHLRHVAAGPEHPCADRCENDRRDEETARAIPRLAWRSRLGVCSFDQLKLGCTPSTAPVPTMKNRNNFCESFSTRALIISIHIQRHSSYSAVAPLERPGQTDQISPGNCPSWAPNTPCTASPRARPGAVLAEPRGRDETSAAMAV
jgi:hypothetical protein